MMVEWLEALQSHLPPTLPSEPAEWGEICHEAKPVLLAPLLHNAERPVLIVVSSLERAETWMAILLRLGIPETRVLRMPTGMTPLIEPTGIELEVRHDRIRALRRLQRENPLLVLAPVSAVVQRTLTPEAFRSLSLTLTTGMSLPPGELLKTLIRLGYEYEEPVRLPGQFARRGGIIDLFPLGVDLPVRIEFFGDQIDSLRRFEPSTQRSVKGSQQVFVPPAREVPLGNEETASRIEAEWTQRAGMLPEPVRSHALETLEADLISLRQGKPFDRLEIYAPQLLPAHACALDYLHPEGHLILDEPFLLQSAYTRLCEALQSAFQSRAERGDMVPQQHEDYLEPLSRVEYHPARLTLNMMETIGGWERATGEENGSESPEPPPRSEIHPVLKVGAKTLETYRGRLPALWETIQTWRRNGFQIIFATDQPSRVEQVLKELEIPVAASSSPQLPRPAVILHRGHLGGGFLWEQAKFALITDAELFDRNRLRLPARTFNEGVPLTSIMDLKPGDYVVHIHHGIGVFRGLTTLNREGETKEYLLIEYAPPDKLYVPADQLDRVQKYLAPDDNPPGIRRINSIAWAKAVASARKKAQEVAQELVKLYAAREKIVRPPYGEDTPWQEEMEAAFPYQETPTQLKAILDLKQDMEAPHPMDRLVCGDVGFGKTEVAIRAAFKAIMAGRQVAVLCPTTVLAYQHWQTFVERFGGYPVEIALMSRLVSGKEQKRTLQAIKSGAVDLVIGTHRLLSKDVEFQNLGMVIIDEEQRFGVMQKERFKQLRTKVDVLTLSATPIPRTLYMALTEIRDMSLITDPPPGRLPIRTYVQPETDYLIREAILRELQRDGQVFYVSNRIQGLEHKAQKLKELVPHARIAVAHGQMNPAEMEGIMLGFYKREYDVLACTTIIENGLDMPNVNTLIVDRAERFGLGQLYQLRGRVGRSDRQAYAYLLYRAGQKLSEAALDRLQALKEFSHLGSGFALAMRDMEIRGAGNLLGTEQHGAVTAVGFELYQMMLREAIQRIRQGDPTFSLDAPLQTELPPFKVPVPVHLPETYIADDSQRLWYYKRIAGARDHQELEDLKRELRDRYGSLPEPVRNALRVMGLRIMAFALGIKQISADRYRMEIEMNRKAQLKARVQLGFQKTFKGLKAQPDKIILPQPDDPLRTIETIFKTMMEYDPV